MQRQTFRNRVMPAAVIVVAVVVILARLQSGKPLGPLPNWTPDTTETSGLADVRAVRDFALRPPVGYKTFLANRYQLWLDAPGSPGAYFDVTVAKADGPDFPRNAEEIMRHVDNPKKYSDRVDSRLDWGKINGVPFVRSDWHGIDHHGVTFHGFQYSTVTSHGFVVSIYGRAPDPGSAAILKTMDTSARTIAPSGQTD